MTPFVLDFLPPRSTDPMHFTPKFSQVTIPQLLRDAHSVVDALKDCGVLSGTGTSPGPIEALGPKHVLPDEAAIPLGKRLDVQERRRETPRPG